MAAGIAHRFALKNTRLQLHRMHLQSHVIPIVLLDMDVALLRSRNIRIDVILSVFPHFSMTTSGFLGFFPQILSTASYNASSSAYLIPFHSIEPSLNFKAAMHCVLIESYPQSETASLKGIVACGVSRTTLSQAPLVVVNLVKA